MLREDQKKIIKNIVNHSLDKAERHWREGGYQLAKSGGVRDFALAEAKAETEPSNIPGHGIVSGDSTVIDEFIAFVVDMRDSSRHLMCAISEKSAKVTGLQRVYYETSALLPAIEQTVKFEDGSVTEYLGDGVLALFKVEQNSTDSAIYSAHAAARNVINDTRDIVNNVLYNRYLLPNLDIGIGLAMSKTLVTLFGLSEKKHPKAFGECVFRATKLSGGRNAIHTDKVLYDAWPTSEGGRVTFRRKSINDVDGYLIGLKEK